MDKWLYSGIAVLYVYAQRSKETVFLRRDKKSGLISRV
ncbi:hypothetical protein J699_03417 [Acinetobacter sp. 1000160]|nr:hypothetical protein J522_2761 [Acinetobacter baumannii 146457]EYT15286.1 hypothetical protein J699_03417 [Acinetobacter sp. 1000160]